MMNDKISIILPLYNSEQYLERCINSIINQTYENFELILIDDGSTDKTLEKIKEYEKKDSRIVIITKKNSGVSDSRNIGILNSSGKYITFVDSDDWLEKDAIENLYNCIIETKYPIVRGKYVIEYKAKSKSIVEKFAYNEDIANTNISRLIDNVISGEMNCYMWLLLIDSKVIKNKIYFNNRLAMMEDTIFYLDLLLENNDIYFLNKTIYHYYVNPESASRNSDYTKRNLENSIEVNRIFEEKLNKYNCNSIDRKKMYNTKTSKAISECLYKLYCSNSFEFYEEYNKIINSDEIRQILKNCDMKKINFQNKYIIRFLISKSKYLLMIFLKLRKLLSIIKKNRRNR